MSKTTNGHHTRRVPEKEKKFHQTDARLAGFPPRSSFEHTKRQNQTSSILETNPAMFSVIRASAESHRVELKDAAFVKMRNSVSFY
ncbi:hypothetical protein R3P38DRAFT_2821121, partial [Favolaschia claudopus]